MHTNSRRPMRHTAKHLSTVGIVLWLATSLSACQPDAVGTSPIKQSAAEPPVQQQAAVNLITKTSVWWGFPIYLLPERRQITYGQLSREQRSRVDRALTALDATTAEKKSSCTSTHHSATQWSVTCFSGNCHCTIGHDNDGMWTSCICH
jgi:hypothetical protein